jgi:hypothetical protein
MVFGLGALTAEGFTLSFQAGDFGTTPVFSNVTTFDFEATIAGGLGPGVYSDPTIGTIGYNVSGSLAATPSGFPAFSFQLSHLIAPPPAGPTVITGALFDSLNPSAPAGDRLSFAVSPTADLSDGLQVSELAGSGSDVVFRFNGREVGTGRYHPMFIELRADGTGLIQNANNMGGDNPFDGFVGDINVDFGDEYITNLTFDPSALTIAVPEPHAAILFVLGMLPFVWRKRRTVA